ncbi:cleavage stimulation factor subunit 2 isoform X2 [Anabrus simplex]|uniref:cleavage stimulation factor subunit 2 isoform X2 n=1 Tax=Anabrus simplex TaxID=316456 RepID=UPI0035A3CBE3
MTDQSLMDKSLRSVFVGNIPYEATEEKLKDIFSEVGPVLSFKLVYDRETGKPKGYGFCEYKDQETALSAMRNLNGYEIGGRTLRVDNACTEKSRMEMQSLLQGPVVENPYGEAVQADKAPEAISKAVASLPPEQMFELMKQMKLCVQNNPSEARQMLLQNPQLAYALLQAQVVMRIVDPQTAVSMLHKANPIPQVLVPAEKPVAPAVSAVPVQAPVAQPQPAPVAAPPTTIVREEAWPVQPGIPIGPRPAAIPAIPAPVQNQATPFVASDVDHRPLDPRLARMGDQDLRVPPAGAVVMQPIQPQTQPAARDPRENFPVEQPQLVETAESFPRDPRQAVPERFPRDPRERVDPRTGVAPLPVAPPRAPAPVPPVMAPRPTPAPNMSPSIGGGASDQEKAALIMQVLQLSDEQIAMLPPEQRQSILVLKEQIAKSTQR